MAIVTQPQLAPPPHSLIRAADTTRDNDPDWTKGLQYWPEAPGGYRTAAVCDVPNPFEEVDHRAAVPATVDYQPFEIQFWDPCETTFGYNAQDVTDRLRRMADATESYAIANELWTGELATASGSGNASFASATTVVGDGTPVSPKRGLGMLEGAVSDALLGGQAMIHMSRETRPYMWELEKVGNLLFTKLDNFVVCDAGYPGTPPTGTAPVANVAWVYATGMVVVRRSPLWIDAAANEVIDTATNTRYRFASKLAAATFDPATLFAVPITLD